MVLERAYGAPEIVNDGVTIARDIEFADRAMNATASARYLKIPEDTYVLLLLL